MSRTELVADAEGLEARLSIRGLTKTYPGTVALKHVDLDLAAGEVHSLVGSNGSGKSTLIKILAGVVTGDEGGTITVSGDEIASEDVNPRWSHAHHLRFVHQQPSIFEDLSVAENLAVDGAYPRKFPLGPVSWRDLDGRAAETLARFNLDVDPRATVSSLRPAQRMMLSIVRALKDREASDRSVLVLDEPTAALPKAEVALLLDTIRGLANSGETIVYVSHRLDEVLSISDRITVLRDGRRIDTLPARALDHSQLIELMVGSPIDSWEEIERGAPGQEVLRVSGFSAGNLHDVNLSLRAREVVGVAGLLGSGRSRLLKALFGCEADSRGDVMLDSVPIHVQGPTEAMNLGLAFVPEDRQRDAAFMDLTVADNLTAGHMLEQSRRVWLSPRKESQVANALKSRFGVKTASVGSLISSLSGGNAQKVIMARWLSRSPRVLLLDEPSQGVDAKARDDIHGLIRSAVDQGATALIVSSDSEELAYYCDRVLVLAQGTIVDEISGADLTANTIDKRVFTAQSMELPA